MDRHINILLSKNGNVGGTSIGAYLEYKKVCEVLPPLLSCKDIIQFAMSVPASKAYFIDMPRKVPRNKLDEFWNGMEMLKDGRLYDCRFKGRKRTQDTCCLWIKTNDSPKLDSLSRNRWVIWDVDPETDELILHPDYRELSLCNLLKRKRD